MKYVIWTIYLCCVIAVACAPANATTYYVATNGSDSWPGTSSQPWLTLQKAADTVVAGDTVIVRNGTYTGFRVTESTSGSYGSPITFQAENTGQVTLNAKPTGARHNGIIELEGYWDTSTPISYWVIEGFVLDGVSKTLMTLDTRWVDHSTFRSITTHHSSSRGLYISHGNYNVMEYCTSYSNGEHGSYQANSATYNTYRGNTCYSNTSAGFHNNGDLSGGGTGRVDYSLYEKNIAYGNPGKAFNCDGVCDSTFKNNLVYSNPGSGFALYVTDASKGSSDNLIYNNTVVMPTSGDWCIKIPSASYSGGSGDPSGNKLKNNIFTAPSGNGSILTYSSSPTGFQSDYNIVMDSFSIDDGDSSVSLSTWRTYGFDTHSIISNPTALFVNPGSNDYHLKDGSPAINAGTTLSEVTDDMDGVSRPQGTAYDIGCYEKQESSTLTITTTSLPGGQVGVAYSQTVQATGGTTPYTWSVLSGSLPAGLSLGSSSGTISGTPTASGTSNFTIRVTDNVSATDDQALSIVISAPANLVITTTSLPDGQLGAAYSQTVQATGGITPYSWSVLSGSLPAGLSLGSSSGTISGTPTATGTSNFTVRVTDSQGTPDTDDQALSITVSAAAMYESAASDTESSTTSTAYQTKVSLGFSTGAADTWVIFGYAEYKGSSTSYSTLVRLAVDSTTEAETTAEPNDATDYCSFGAVKVASLSSGSHTITLDYRSENSGATAYVRNARVVAVKKSALLIASAAADSTTALTTTLTNYVTANFTPASSGDYLLVCSAEVSANTSYSTQVQAKLGGTVLDECLVESKDNTDYFTFASFSVVNCAASAQTLTVTAAKESASTATHNIRRARAVAIRLSGSRLDGYQSAAADTESTTTSTAFQEKLTKSWNVTSAGNWLLLTSFRNGGTSASYSIESRVQLNDSTAMAQPLREPNDTTDYVNGASVDVRNLATGTRYVDVDYRSENSGATAKIKYAHIAAIPLDGTGGIADLVITTTSLPGGMVGVAYSQTVQATGGQTPYSWSVISGSLPAGLSLGSSSGTISGTPTASGTSNFTVRVTDSQGTPDTDDQALSITINPSIPDLVITTTSVPNGQIGVAYSQTVQATGGVTPYSWSVISGSLPAGLSLGSSSGTISGTPTASGTSNFTVRVTDSQGTPDTDDQALSIVIPANLVITTTSLPNGQIGVAYSQTVQATGGVTPYSWSVISGSLPSGLSLGSSSGTISGTPTASGTSNFTVRVTDSQGTPDTDDQALSIVIPANLVITTTSVPNGQIGVAYSQTVQATGGVTPYSWSVISGSLPSGLSLGSSSGTISGTPTASGTSNFTVRVTDSQGTPDTDDQALSIVIPANLVITTTSVPNGQIGVAYSQTVQATGGVTPYSWSVLSGSLPAGLSLGSSSGTISGTPTATGTSNFTVRVTDSQSPADTDDQALSITIPADLVITTTSLPGGTVGTAYSQTVVATGGTTPYSWSAISGSLPAGLSLGSSSGTISGTPTATGTSNFTVRVTDSQGTPDTDDQALSITINPADLVITTTSLPGGTVGIAYGQTVQATGGVTPYSWSIISGSLPAGLSMGSSTGTISGTPTTSGTSNFTVRVTDSQGTPDTDDQALSIVISSGGTSATYQFVSSNSESTTTSTAYTNKATMTFTPNASDDWIIFASAEFTESSTSYRCGVRFTIDGAVAQDTDVAPKDTTDYQSFMGMKVVTLSVASHTMNIDYKSSSASGTAYIRNARIVAIRKSSLELYSNDGGDSGSDLTTTMTDYATTGWTPPSSADYLLVWSCSWSAETTSYNTTIEGRLNSGALDLTTVVAGDTSNHYTFVGQKTAWCDSGVSQTMTLAAAKESGSTAVHHIERARVAAFNLTTGRFSGFVKARDDAESTTTSTSWQQKLTMPVSVSTAADWFVVCTWRLGNSSTSYSSEVQLQLDNSTTEANQLRRPQNTADYFQCGGVDVRNLSTGTRTFDVDYRTKNSSGTARIKNCHLIAIPL